MRLISYYLLLLELRINHTFLQEALSSPRTAYAKIEDKRAKKPSAAMLEVILSLNGVLADQTNSAQSLPNIFPVFPDLFEHIQVKTRAKRKKTRILGPFSCIFVIFCDFLSLVICA